jgi:hypothetical protein
MTVSIKRDLGQGQAFLGDRSFSSSDGLPDVLRALAQGPIGQLNAYQATIAAATLNGIVACGAGKIVGLRTSVAVCGSADSTTVQVQKNGTSVGELTTGNAEADGIKKSLAIDVDIVAGDLIQLVVTAAPTGGTGLTVSAKLQPVIVES